MDHLPIPVGGRRIAVPFTAKRAVYRPCDFFELPKRVGFEDFNDLLERGYKCKTDMNKAAAEQFLQSWLWFALLSEVLGVDIDSTDFEAIDNVLDSSKLSGLLVEWEGRENQVREAGGEPSPDQKLRYTRGAMALADAREVYIKALHVRKDGSRCANRGHTRSSEFSIRTRREADNITRCPWRNAATSAATDFHSSSREVGILASSRNGRTSLGL